MPETLEEIDPIDGVATYLEQFYTSSSFSRLGPDFISDSYLRAIDLSTQPGRLNMGDTKKLNRAINSLNENYIHIHRRLGNSGVLGIYNDVAVQINEMNASDPDRSHIVSLVTTEIVRSL